MARRRTDHTETSRRGHERTALTQTVVPKAVPLPPVIKPHITAGASNAHIGSPAAPAIPAAVPAARSSRITPSLQEEPTVSHLRQQISGSALLLIALLFLTTITLSLFTGDDHALGPWLGTFLSKFLFWSFGGFTATVGTLVLALFAVRLIIHDRVVLRRLWSLGMVLWIHTLFLLSLGELVNPVHNYETFAHSGGLLGHLLVRALFLPIFGAHRLGPVLILLVSLIGFGLWTLRITPRESLLVAWAFILESKAKFLTWWKARREQQRQPDEAEALKEALALAGSAEPRGRFLDRHLQPEPEEDGTPLAMPSSVILPPRESPEPGAPQPYQSVEEHLRLVQPEVSGSTPPPPEAPAQESAPVPAESSECHFATPDPEAGLGDHALGVYRNLSAWRPLQVEDLRGLNPLEIRRLKARDEEIRLAAQLNAWEDQQIEAKVSRRPRITAPEPDSAADASGTSEGSDTGSAVRDDATSTVDSSATGDRLPNASAMASSIPLPPLPPIPPLPAAAPAGLVAAAAEATAVAATAAATAMSDVTRARLAHARRHGGGDAPQHEISPNPIEPGTGSYRIPDVSILPDPPMPDADIDDARLQSMAGDLELQLRNFSVAGKVTQIEPGPVITRFKVELGPGTPVRKIVNLSDDLAMALCARRIRIQAPIPGEKLVGIEIPNEKPETVHLKEILHAPQYHDAHLKVPVVLGKDIVGNPVVTDLTRAPHLLIAGQTGSGKSVCINTIMASILFSQPPERLRMVLIDPKVVELSTYQKIPHLLSPVVTRPEEAVQALKWIVEEMDRRYEVLAVAAVRNIAGFNAKVEAGTLPDELNVSDRVVMPYLLVVIDEFADLMMVAGKEVEKAVMRIAQKARAVGVHLILATQRPSTDVITGVLKANLPSRIAFQVASQIDSRTILDRMGAEDLLGRGDMLFNANEAPEPRRVHGAFVSDGEAELIADACASQNVFYPQIETFLTEEGEEEDGGSAPADRKLDDKLPEAARRIVSVRHGSVSMLQRTLGIGFARAGRIMDQLEQIGIVGKDRGSKPREVLVDELQLEDMLSRFDGYWDK